MKIVGFVLVIAFAAFINVQVASAHVLIKSTNNQSAAILHVIPDDDPIAGQEASLSLDTEGGVLQSGATVTLVVTDASGQVEQVATQTKGSLVSSVYVFPTQGVYSLKYSISTTTDTSYQFVHDIRVSRGVQGGAVTVQRYPWAEALLIAMVILFVVLAVIGWNNRKSIYNSSVL